MADRYFTFTVRDPIGRIQTAEQIREKLKVALWPGASLASFREYDPSPEDYARLTQMEARAKIMLGMRGSLEGEHGRELQLSAQCAHFILSGEAHANNAPGEVVHTYKDSRVRPEIGDGFRAPSINCTLVVLRVTNGGEYIENAGWPTSRFKTDKCTFVERGEL